MTWSRERLHLPKIAPFVYTSFCIIFNAYRWHVLFCDSMQECCLFSLVLICFDCFVLFCFVLFLFWFDLFLIFLLCIDSSSFVLNLLKKVIICERLCIVIVRKRQRQLVGHGSSALEISRFKVSARKYAGKYSENPNQKKIDWHTLDMLTTVEKHRWK